MNIGMLNLHYTYENFGAVLVPYSLGVILKRLGHDITLIDFQNSWYAENKKKNNLEKWGAEFETFRNEYLPKRTRKYYSPEELKELDQNIDVYVVGSDQIWRYDSDDGIKTYFLEFASNTKKKVSYAASFGKNIWDGNRCQRERVKEALKSFDLITVREKSGIDICKNDFDAIAVQVLDPTFLLDKNDYEIIIKNSNYEKEKFNYIATSILSVNEDSNYIIRKICKEYNFKNNNILGKEYYVKELEFFIRNVKEFVKSVLNFKYRYFTYYIKRILWGKAIIKYNSVGEWLGKLQDAELVITDSFHCIVFSIIFEKDFFCVLNDRGAERIKNLFQLLNISEKRIIFAEDSIRFHNIEPIDYKIVKEILLKEKHRCIELLYTAIEL